MKILFKLMWEVACIFFHSKLSNTGFITHYNDKDISTTKLIGAWTNTNAIDCTCVAIDLVEVSNLSLCLYNNIHGGYIFMTTETLMWSH